jgi:hypothetical protein
MGRLDKVMIMENLLSVIIHAPKPTTRPKNYPIQNKDENRKE